MFGIYMSGILYVVGLVLVVVVVICGKFVVICVKALTQSFPYEFGQNFHSMVGVVCMSGMVHVVDAVFVVGVVICGKWW